VVEARVYPVPAIPPREESDSDVDLTEPRYMPPGLTQSAVGSPLVDEQRPCPSAYAFSSSSASPSPSPSRDRDGSENGYSSPTSDASPAPIPYDHGEVHRLLFVDRVTDKAGALLVRRMLSSASREERDALLLTCCERVQELEDSLAFITYLVDHLEADVNVTDGEGSSALLHVCAAGDQLVGSYLIRRGADVLLRNRKGLSPLSLALESEQLWFVQTAVQSNGFDLESMANGEVVYLMSQLLTYGYGGQIAILLESVVSTGEEGQESDGLTATNIASALGQYLSTTEVMAALERFQGEFADMKEPVATYELLENLELLETFVERRGG